MAREFTRNMLIMLVTIMVGIVIITYFAADITRRSQIDTLNVEHKTEIRTITNKNENFTDHFLQGMVKMDAAREIREIGNYHFDFALFWFTNARIILTNESTSKCIENCTNAMVNYLKSYQDFNLSKPYFTQAKQFTNTSKYIEILGYYAAFAQLGKNITMLRYNASLYLKQAMENLSLGQLANVSFLMNLFNQTELAYGAGAAQYDAAKGLIDEYWFFDTIREPH